MLLSRNFFHSSDRIPPLLRLGADRDRVSVLEFAIWRDDADPEPVGTIALVTISGPRPDRRADRPFLARASRPRMAAAVRAGVVLGSASRRLLSSDSGVGWRPNSRQSDLVSEFCSPRG